MKPGQRIGTNTLVRQLGGGGNGEVWLATSEDGQEVAIKMSRRGGIPRDAAPRFEREIRALIELRGSAGILPILEHGEIDGRRWFAMPVAKVVREKLGDQAALENVCSAIHGFAETLARLHQKGISHRDIKPDNLYWWNKSWCLGDFGLVQLPDATQITASDQKLGPAFYIAPEMLQNPAAADGSKADVYSLGKVLWTLATGQRYPLPGEHSPSTPAMTISAYVRHPRAGLLDGLLFRMTRHNPVHRPTADTICKELDAWLHPTPVAEGSAALGDVLKQLRGAVEPHNQRAEIEARKKKLATALLQRLRVEIDQLARTIESETGLRGIPGRNAPKYLFFSPHIGSARAIMEDAYTVSFRSGGDYSWRFTILATCVLLSNDTVQMSAGFLLDRFIFEHKSNSIGD